ncbi:MAG: ribonuclease Z [Phaeodactylibacter sp.]|nr:ribonuclease Z [Phaeodactylibacter sp.]
MRFELTLLGTNSALPAYGRFPTAQVLNIQEKLYLIDCGEGAQIRMGQFGLRQAKISQAFISHLHGDHIYGLIGWLTSLALINRQEPLDIFAPEGLEEIIRVQLKYTGGLPYSLSFYTIDPSRHSLIFEDKRVAIFSLPLAHRIPATGFLFREKEKARNIRPDCIEAYQIPFQAIPGIKAGNDYQLEDGRLIPNADLTLDPPKPRTYAFCSDTAYHEPLIPLIQGVDLLYHESTFCDDLVDIAAETGHSTARQAATIALKAGVARLVLGHYSSRYPSLEPFLLEARSVFPNTELGVDGASFEVPLQGRG